jgi:hypothetical protein
MTLQMAIQKHLPATVVVVGAISIFLRLCGCDGGEKPAAPATPATFPTGASVRSEEAFRDSIKAVLYTEIRAELESAPAGRVRIIRIKADPEIVAVADSALADSLRAAREVARTAIAIAKRAQAELQLLRGKADVLAVLDDTLAVPDAESVFTAHAEYSYRDASFKNVLLSHAWVEEHKTLWDTLVAYAPYAAGALALLKTVFDLFTPTP